MIGGLCESPLTMRMLMVWRDEIVAGNMLLRDVIDLETTYGKPEGPSAPTTMMMTTLTATATATKKAPKPPTTKPIQ